MQWSVSRSRAEPPLEDGDRVDEPVTVTIRDTGYVGDDGEGQRLAKSAVTSTLSAAAWPIGASACVAMIARQRLASAGGEQPAEGLVQSAVPVTAQVHQPLRQQLERRIR